MPTLQTIIGELPHKRTSNSKHYLMSDGSYQAVIFSGDVHYEDENGNLQNIDTDLYDEADFDVMEFPVSRHKCDAFRSRRQIVEGAKRKGVLDRERFDFHALRVPFAATISRNFRKGYSIGKGENKLTFKPVGASVSVGRLNEEKRNEVEYQDAWNDVDVKLEMTERGIKETLILKTEKAPTTFSFQVDGNITDDLTAGELLLENAWLIDASGERRDVDQKIRRENDKIFVDVQAHTQGLTYPILVDPSVQISSSSDSYVDSNQPSVNFGSSQFLYTSYSEASYLKFDLTTIPQNAVIFSADLYAYLYSGSTGTGSPVVTISLVTGSWDESTLTWNNKPLTESTVLDRKIINKNQQYYSWNVSNSVKNHVINPSQNHGFVLRYEADGTIRASYPTFYSSNSASNKPYMAINYNIPPSKPTVISPNGGENWNALHTIRWNPATDSSTPTYFEPVTPNTFSTVAAGGTIGQSFTVDRDAYITRVDIRMGNTVAGTFTKTMKLEGVGADGFPNGVVYAQASISVGTTSTSGFYGFYLPTPIKVPVGTKLAITVMDAQSGTGVAINNAGNTYPGGEFIIKVADSWSNRPYDGAIMISYDDATPQNKLKYHIQLTTDNGVNWSDIISLTADGATSYSYDFTPKPETSLAKVRIRAYDGHSYGPWDESDGVFTIMHNQAPAAPTNLSPSGGIAVDRTVVQRFSWQHNDPNSNDPQSKFDLQWREVGSSTWNTVTQTTPNQYWNAPANTFSRANFEWHVRTYDQAGLVGPYSTQAIFFAGDKPASTTIIGPASPVPVARPTLEWSSYGQTAYQVQVLGASRATLWDSNEITSLNKARTIGMDLTNNTSYILRVRIKNADGLWSSWVEKSIVVSYTTPPTPLLTITAYGREGRIAVSIKNPTPTGTEPNVTSNDLYRREVGHEEWTRLKVGAPPNDTYYDFTVASGTEYEYMLRAFGDNGTITDSHYYQGTVHLNGVWLHCVGDPSGTTRQFVLRSGYSDEWKAEGALMQFAGRKRPVAEFGEGGEGNIKVDLSLLKGSEDRISLQRIVSKRSTVCYRDNRGRKMFGVIFVLPSTDTYYGYDVSLSIDETDYREDV
ncbi:DNRLRE domain-containing protein [Brevibacillus reuszeri]|uniref:DNRLRE domain-containing protein n=1 Tax=Brevibacillus reuszeri TaxID=54915 RepID=UPI003D22B421